MWASQQYESYSQYVRCLWSEGVPQAIIGTYRYLPEREKTRETRRQVRKFGDDQAHLKPPHFLT